MVALLCGCIHNDLPYPRIQPNFSAFMVNGMTKPAEIDTLNRVITLDIDEETNLEAVELVSYTLSPDGAVLSDDAKLGPTLNLIKPLYVTLRLYQEYVWTIRARQTIEREFAIEGQIGQTIIDVPGRRVIVYVPKGSNLAALKVTKAKLGSTASTLTPDPVGQTMDFTHPLELTLTCGLYPSARGRAAPGWAVAGWG
ncbi:MAG: hypothetical protein K2K82_06205, partial [Muribaculaceae bacterium]|nr:hypothetical protein [Muribaculaceae bacterium]